MERDANAASPSKPVAKGKGSAHEPPTLGANDPDFAEYIATATAALPKSTLPKSIRAIIDGKPTTGSRPTTGSKPTTGTGSRKRKSDADTDIKAVMFPDDAIEIDEDDRRLYQVTDSCQKIRRKIHNWIDSGAMKVGEFQKELGVSSKSYLNFMNRKGTWDGRGCETYVRASAFFKKRELQGLPLQVPKAKRAKTAASGAGASKASRKEAQEKLLDTSGVELGGEDDMGVPVFDTCDEIRKKIRALLAKGVSQAAFARTLAAMYPEGSGKNVSSANVSYFLGQKGALSGNTSTTLYAAYVFFEKRRIKEGKPKSGFREDMEEIHGPRGVDRESNVHQPVFCRAGEVPYVNRYGKFDFQRG
jgi:hypothetical protein